MYKYKSNYPKLTAYLGWVALGIAFIFWQGIGCTIQKPFTEYDGAWKEATVVSGKAELHTKTIGEGAPILVVHGGPGLSHQYFLPHILGLTESGYQLIFYDHRNAGKSSAIIDSNAISLDWYLQDILAILDHYSLEKVNLLAHSWGATLALQLAIRHPDKLESLILLNPNAPSDTLTQLENAAMMKLRTPADQDTIQRLMNSQRFKNQEVDAFEHLFELNFHSLFYDRSFTDDLSIELPDDFVSRNSMLQYLGKDFKFYDVTYLLEEIMTPTLVVYGVHEPGSTLSGPIYESNLPNGQLLILPRCGHFPFIEQPYTLFREINSFITWNTE